MAGISTVLGSYSGVTGAEIDKLIEAESAPLIKLTKQKTKYLDQQTAWKDIKLRVNTLFLKIEDLQKNETFNTKIATSSDANKVTISGTAEALAENYQISVERLATATKITSGKIPAMSDKDIYADLGFKGDLELTNNDGELSKIEVAEGDSLKDIVTKINEMTKTSGVKGAIVNNRLVLSDVKTGERNLSVGGSLVNELGFSSGDSKVTQGENAKFTIDGMEVERSSNKISDVVENLTIDLHGKTTEPVSLSLKVDEEKLIKSVKELVEQYNSVMEYIDDKTSAGDPSKPNNKSGVLVGESSLTRLQSSLRSLMTGVPDTNSTTGITKPSEVGISSKDRTSKVVFDEAVFKKALAEDPQAVQNFFFNKVDKEVKSTDETGQEVLTTEKASVGYTTKLQSLVNSFLNDDKDKKSVLTIRNESISQSLERLETRITRFNETIDKKRERYVRIYTRLDQVMMQAESQMAYLQSQMDSFAAR